MTAAQERACEILEKSNRLPSIEEAQAYIDNARTVYDCLYSDIVQRHRALQDIETYTALKSMLERSYFFTQQCRDMGQKCST